MKIEGDKVFFDGGRVAYANGGVIGISHDGQVCTGWDDVLSVHDLSDAERAELADYMIQQWTSFRDGSL